MSEPEMPDRVDAEIQFRNSLLVMQALSELLYVERFKTLAPGIAKELQRLGVKFPEAKAGRG